ncbi:MAG: hypothetical protein MUC60_07070 [Oscillatoria sp. Prado101]|nr:hypothetical protein [Oscillatoria sp. Prado101]
MKATRLEKNGLARIQLQAALRESSARNLSFSPKAGGFWSCGFFGEESQPWRRWVTNPTSGKGLWGATPHFTYTGSRS